MTDGAAAGGTRTTLVTGPSAAAREAAIAAALAADGGAGPAAVVLEGLADATSPLAANDLPAVQVLRIAPGCLCCAGNLVLRVTLNRLLRHPPARLYISLANAEHADQLREMLSDPPYVSLLTLGPYLHAGLT
ncbi:hypothetical protein [Pseudoduganella namucuonensis]|uniref:GTPase n=1 Tax=Pseudoduganella namucuonensis TaxID=1035707 RepID=A0A1I7ETT2_9BURK|nr:hypothetical protein [Pseudoduganella namucuonensis]SFU27309.1 hypothetical protein SAMN05216552_100154 [Pseudoduganella namucuonensis]